ncbi:sugar transferase [Candidatus Sumerlaeota bacterium]|nr:sugar transferase [Candidatus Sumerlaeota bacterium]
MERLINFITASILLLLFSPFMLLISLILLLFDGCPILYRGKRVGKNGRLFTMYKFRTLYEGSETRIGGKLMKDSEGYITPIGHFLRCLKLDELPQLLNIIKGDMNFVGPRPVRPLMAVEYESKCKDYNQRFMVKPGLTGLAQLRGGYYCPAKRKTRYDLFYIKKRSFILDAKLLALTAIKMICSPNCLKMGDRPITAMKSSEAIKACAPLEARFPAD